MKGMNATTGLDHHYQSITKILTTPIGTSIARRNLVPSCPNWSSWSTRRPTAPPSHELTIVHRYQISISYKP
jgi:hypothetical protein